VYQTCPGELGKLAALDGLRNPRVPPLPRLLLLLICLLPASPRATEVVPWLYEVAVPVADQSESERRRAASEGLKQLLTRLTGLAYVPLTPEVTEALGQPDRYYNEFRFARVAIDAMTDPVIPGEPEDAVQPAQSGLELIIQFDRDPVQALIRSAGLPIWRAQRERVLVWVVLADETGRQIVGATGDASLVGGLNQGARDRGLPMTLPLLDLEDQLAVDPAAVWGRLSQVIDPASRRYGADVLLLGRITPSGEGASSAEGLPQAAGWESDWEFWVDGVVVPFTAEGNDLAEHGRQAVNVLADELAARRVVHGREAGQLRLVVSGIRSPGEYGALLNYLKSLEFVQKVGVTGLKGGRLWLLVDTPADPDRLLGTFERDRQLYDDQLALVDDADLKLVWRGGE
jgi:hypothetical protein